MDTRKRGSTSEMQVTSIRLEPSMGKLLLSVWRSLNRAFGNRH